VGGGAGDPVLGVPHLADFLSVDGFMGHRVGASPSSARLEVLSRAHQGSRSDSSAISASPHGSISTFAIAARIVGALLRRPPPRSNREESTCPVPSAVIPVNLSTLTRRSGIVCVRHHVPAIDRAARQHCLPVSPAVTAPARPAQRTGPNRHPSPVPPIRRDRVLRLASTAPGHEDRFAGASRTFRILRLVTSSASPV
jgi:hypothetical protein